jgi:A/G-specific adenine glycosylase
MNKSSADWRSFRQKLLSWFGQFQRDLPWRRTKDPYRIWVSEIMLQQTRVAAVIPYYERFLGRFPDIRALAEAPEEEVLRLWAGLGYYSRARNLQKAARQMVALHGGEFPRDSDAVHALAGIGNYTGPAILSIAFGQQRAVLDGNVARVLARLYAIRGDLRESRRWQALQQAADELLEKQSPGNWNQAMMELGATVCTPKAPQCLLCPVADWCEARRRGNADAYPEKQKKREAVDVLLAAAVFCDSHGRTLLLPPPAREEARPAADHVPTLVSGMWHFPTVAVHQDAKVELRRYLGHALRVNIAQENMEPLRKVNHAVTYRSVRVAAFRVRVTKLPRVPGSRKLLLEELSSLPVSNLTRKIARAAGSPDAGYCRHEADLPLIVANN